MIIAKKFPYTNVVYKALAKNIRGAIAEVL